MMNCFGWRSRSSEYLDGTLIGQMKVEADLHLDACDRCKTLLERYRKIQSALASLPRSALPTSVRSDPFHPRPEESVTMDPVGSPSTKERRSLRRRFSDRFRTISQFVGFETLTVLFVVMSLLVLIPRIRYFYDVRMAKQLEPFSLAELARDFKERTLGAFGRKGDDGSSGSSGMTGAGAPGESVRGLDTESDSGPLSSFDTDVGLDGDPALSEGDDEFSSSEEGDAEDVPAPKSRVSGTKQIKVAKGEIWRFILKSHNPAETRDRVQKLLKTIGLDEETLAPMNGANSGLTAPGGILLDMNVPGNQVNQVKESLDQLSKTIRTELKNEEIHFDLLTWYRTVSRKPIPGGRAKVVIWMPQI